MKMTHQVTMENKQMLSQTQIQSLEILAMDADRKSTRSELQSR